MKKTITLVVFIIVFIPNLYASKVGNSDNFLYDDSFTEVINKINALGYSAEYTIIEDVNKSFKQIKFDKSVEFENVKMEESFLHFVNDSVSSFIYFLDDENFNKLINRYKKEFGKPTIEKDVYFWISNKSNEMIVAEKRESSTGFNMIKKSGNSAFKTLIMGRFNKDAVKAPKDSNNYEITELFGFVIGTPLNDVYEKLVKDKSKDTNNIKIKEYNKESLIIARGIIIQNFEVKSVLFGFVDNRLESLMIKTQDIEQHKKLVSLIMESFGVPMVIPFLNRSTWIDKKVNVISSTIHNVYDQEISFQSAKSR